MKISSTVSGEKTLNEAIESFLEYVVGVVGELDYYAERQYKENYGARLAFEDKQKYSVNISKVDNGWNCRAEKIG
jgi:anti-anti-sigma regulatory factor